jgi:hypothetical protein
MIIAAGTGRSGTKTIAKLFNMTHEWNAEKLVKHLKLKDNATNPLEDELKKIKILQEHFKNIDYVNFRDSSNLYIHFLHLVYKIYNNVKIVLLVRDPRCFCVSAITRGWHFKERYNEFGMRPTIDDQHFKNWGEYDEVERTAWIWNFRNSVALKNIKAIPKRNVLILKIEDLNKKIKLLSEFLELKPNSEILKGKLKHNKNVLNTYLPPDLWTKTMNDKLHRIAGGMIDELGYGYTKSISLSNRIVVKIYKSILI